MKMIGNKVKVAQKAVCLLIALVLVSGFAVHDVRGESGTFPDDPFNGMFQFCSDCCGYKNGGGTIKDGDEEE